MVGALSALGSDHGHGKGHGGQLISESLAPSMPPPTDPSFHGVASGGAVDTDTMAAETTGRVPIDRGGDARIRDNSFDVPSTCLSPVILVHPNGGLAAYIAVDGWRM